MRKMGLDYAFAHSGCAVSWWDCGKGCTLVVEIHNDPDRKLLLVVTRPLLVSAASSRRGDANPSGFLSFGSQSAKPNGRTGGVLSILMNLNSQLVLGAFEWRHADGQIAFKVPIPYHDSQVTERQVTAALEVSAGAVLWVIPRVRHYVAGETSLDEVLSQQLTALRSVVLS